MPKASLASRELFWGIQKGLCGTKANPHCHGFSLSLFPIDPPISSTSFIQTGSRDLVAGTRVPVMASWNSDFMKFQPAWLGMLFCVQQIPRIQLGIFACVTSTKIVYAWEHTILPLLAFPEQEKIVFGFFVCLCVCLFCQVSFKNLLFLRICLVKLKELV